MATGFAKPCNILWLSALLAAAASAELRIEKVFGEETKTGPYKHPAAIAELDNGDLYLVYYGGGGEYAEQTAVYGARRRAGSRKWSSPVAIARDPFRSLGNAVVWQAPDGVVWLFYVVRYGDSWSTSRIQMKISRDGAATWSDASMLAADEAHKPPGALLTPGSSPLTPQSPASLSCACSSMGMMVRGRPIVLPGGDYLLPVYHETGGDRESVGPDSTSRFLRFDTKTKQWTPSGVIRSKKGNIQPAVAALADGRVIAYCRRGGGYGPVTDGYIVRAESNDNGRTWTEGKDSPFPNPNSAIDLLGLANGHLLLVYNASMSRRTPLRVALSTDGDRTWPHSLDIASGPGSFAYPYAIQKRDGSIAVVYTSHERRQVNLAEFTEADLQKGQ